MGEIQKMETESLAAIEKAETLESLEGLRVAYLGKKGSISGLLQGLKGVSQAEKVERSKPLNEMKNKVAAAIAERKAVLEERLLSEKLKEETMDVSLPAPQNGMAVGRIHPLSRAMEDIYEIAAQFGFRLAHGPDIESEYYNFTALNIPEHHPARQMHDSFYFPKAEGDEERLLLRTHTSPVQIHAMEGAKPPFRFIAPGRTYRCDSDQTHTPMFHQIEGVVVEEGIHLGHLRWVLESFLKAFFEVEELSIRFRPSYFPFTEPSMEVDVQCRREKNAIHIGEGEEWLEILGCGMIHPNVLSAVGLDAKKVKGFAFGIGIDRLAMLKYGISDLRAFFASDLQWLRHYGFASLGGKPC